VENSLQKHSKAKTDEKTNIKYPLSIFGKLKIKNQEITHATH
jgi:hypothetical protein